MQVKDFSKNYVISKGCGNHAEIFPKNIFCGIAGFNRVWQNKSHG